MKKKHLVGEELLTMQQEKGNICVSIIVPTHRLSPERRVDKLEVERAINSAKQLLQYNYPEANINPLQRSLDELYEQIDFTHNADGVGLYVSTNYRLLVQYPFPVVEKVMVSENFELRDLLYKVNYSMPYFALLLTEKELRLFEGEWDQLEEMKDTNFPLEYTEEYSYNPPSRSAVNSGYSHVKTVEKDRSTMETIRVKDFFEHADELLNNYLVADTPLVLLGTEKELARFDDISAHKKHIVNTIKGSYDYSSLSQLADKCWPLMHDYLKNKQVQLIKEFEEKIGEHLGISGIQQVWQAAKAGVAFKLLVEKDYKSPGFTDTDTNQLYLRPPEKLHRILADAVDDIIELVLEKNGQVHFVENDMLKDYQRIALITRY
jgi:Bacterial archaeo-eukaryotic release factor family 3